MVPGYTSFLCNSSIQFDAGKGLRKRWKAIFRDWFSTISYMVAYMAYSCLFCNMELSIMRCIGALYFKLCQRVMNLYILDNLDTGSVKYVRELDSIAIRPGQT
jgi:hypothetical protein